MLTFEEWRHTYADVFETEDAARAAWTAASNHGYRAGMQDTRELLAAHSAGARGEPVAWRVNGTYTNGMHFSHIYDDKATAEKSAASAAMRVLTPLYAHPQPMPLPAAPDAAPSPDREQVGNTKEDRYQMVCAAAYQLAGVVNAPLRFLDALSDAANGEPMNNAIDLLPVTIDEFGSASPSRECGERQECHHGQDNGACGWCYDEAARGEQMAMNREDVERQYKDGIHIGSGLPRATCPCGLCSKHRFGFNSGGGVPIAAASASTLSERSECTCGNGLGHARHCPAFDESKMRYEPFALPQPQAAEPRGLTLEQREAIKWALGVAHSGAKATPEGLLMFNRWKALCALLSKGE